MRNSTIQSEPVSSDSQIKRSFFSHLWNFLWRIGRIIIPTYIGIIILAFLFESRLVYHPTKLSHNNPSVKMFPEGIPVDFSSEDGTRLRGELLLSSGRITQNTIPILFNHGNGKNIYHNRHWVFFNPRSEIKDDGVIFSDKMTSTEPDFALFFYDYRGYGLSDGSLGGGDLTQENVMKDARAARKWLAHRCGKEEKDVVLMGHSLGGSVTCQLACHSTPALVLFSTFNTVTDVAAAYLPLAPTKWLMRNTYDSEACLPKINAPLLQFHARRDFIVPYRFGKRLFNAYHGGEKEWVDVPPGYHDYELTQEHRDKIRQFIISNYKKYLGF